MTSQRSRCLHVTTLGDYTKDDVLAKQQVAVCDTCGVPVTNLWVCLHRDCFYVGCGEARHDHSTQHYTQNVAHAITLNLTTLRVWCYVCQGEVFLENNDPPVGGNAAPLCPPLAYVARAEPDTDDDDMDVDGSSGREDLKPLGLTGLQNIGNTCYMNAALQALSNCPPLTHFFLECTGFIRADKKPALSRSYMKLMADMWHKKRPGFVVPSSIAYGIKLVYPMFRGYTQQDSQEFLRCFMDQLHEELKEPVVELDQDTNLDPLLISSGMFTAAGGDAELAKLFTHEGRKRLQLGEIVDDDDEDEEMDMEGVRDDSVDTNSERAGSPSSLDQLTAAVADTMETRSSVGATVGSPALSIIAGDSSQSEAEYETCDSGLSSEKSSVSEHAGGTTHIVLSKKINSTKDYESIGRSPRAKSHPINLPGGTFNDSGYFKKPKGRGIGGSRLSIGKTAPSSEPRGVHKSTYSANTLESGYHSLHDETEAFIGSRSCPEGLGESPEESNIAAQQPAASFPPDGKPPRPLRGLSVKVTPALASSAPTPLTSRGHVSGGGNVLRLSRRRRQPKYRSVISDIFDGKLLSSVQCLTCNRISATKETFQDLSLPIPSREYVTMLHASQGTAGPKGPLSTCTDVYSNEGWLTWMLSWMKSWFWGPTVSLQDCLTAFFSADELKGDNMYSCDKCKKLRNGIKYSKVLELPEVLCIHLKRFRHELMYSSKISSYVSFPLEGLDMKTFLHKDCPNTVTTYNLVAVICHHGTAGGGHYTAYALNALDEQWYEFDDQYITKVDPQAVANCEAYVLFYRKYGEEMMKKRLAVIDLMEISKREPGLMQFYISKQWVNKFNTFAEPGPINNTDFLCTHGGVHPGKASYVGDLCTIVSQGVWEYLHDSFGSGPVCNHLYVCPVCQQEQEVLERRRKHELDDFVRLHKEFQSQESSAIIYMISMSWFRQWENFVRGKDPELPGPIDNSSIAVNKNGQYVLKMGSDYAQISPEIWNYLFGIYGGGPELPLRQSNGSLYSVIPPVTSHSVTNPAPAVTATTSSSVVTANPEPVNAAFSGGGDACPVTCNIHPATASPTPSMRRAPSPGIAKSVDTGSPPVTSQDPTPATDHTDSRKTRSSQRRSTNE